MITRTPIEAPRLKTQGSLTLTQHCRPRDQTDCSCLLICGHSMTPGPPLIHYLPPTPFLSLSWSWVVVFGSCFLCSPPSSNFQIPRFPHSPSLQNSGRYQKSLCGGSVLDCGWRGRQEWFLALALRPACVAVDSDQNFPVLGSSSKIQKSLQKDHEVRRCPPKASVAENMKGLVFFSE